MKPELPTEPSREKTLPTATIHRLAAAKLIDAALTAAAEIGIEVAIAVTDAAGYQKAFERTDGAPFITAEVAINKAWSAVFCGMATHHLSAIVLKPELAPLTNIPRFMPVSGGCPIMENGLLVGGIGVSGGVADQDQQVAETALKALEFEVA